MAPLPGLSEDMLVNVPWAPPPGQEGPQSRFGNLPPVPSLGKRPYLAVLMFS